MNNKINFCLQRPAITGSLKTMHVKANTWNYLVHNLRESKSNLPTMDERYEMLNSRSLIIHHNNSSKIPLELKNWFLNNRSPRLLNLHTCIKVTHMVALNKHLTLFRQYI